MHKQSKISGLLFALAVVGMSGVAFGQAPSAQPNRPAASQGAAPAMPAPVASGTMPNMPRPTTISPAAPPQVPIRQLPPALNPIMATPANPQATRPLPQVAGGAPVPMLAQPAMVGVLPASGQGQPSASPIATTTMPSNVPARLVTAQGVTADGQPVIVYLPPGAQPTASQPWPGGEFTYAPGTNVSSEVPDSFWPSPERQPIGGMVERGGNTEGGGLFHWPKFARGNPSNPAPEVSRPPVRQKGIFNRTEESLFAAKETPASNTPEPPKAEPKALFGGGRSTPVVNRAPAPQLNPATQVVPTVTPEAPQPPAIFEPTASPAPAPLPAENTAVTQASTQSPVVVPNKVAPVTAPPDTAKAAPPASGSDLKWRAKGSPRPVAPVSEPAPAEAKDSAAEAAPDTQKTIAAAAPEVAEEVPAAAAESAPVAQASPRVDDVASAPAQTKSVLTKSEPNEDSRQRALLNRSMLNAPGNFIAGLFTAPAPPGSGGSGRALMPGSASGPKEAERGPTPMPTAVAQAVPRAQVAPAPVAPMVATPAPRQDRALFGGFALAKSQQHVAPSSAQAASLPQSDSPTLADSSRAGADSSRITPALQSELIEAAVPPPVTSLVPQKQLVHSGPSRRANPQAAAQAAAQIAAKEPSASAEPTGTSGKDTVRPMPVARRSTPHDLVEAMPTRRSVGRAPLAERELQERRPPESRQVTYETTQRGPSLGKVLSTLSATGRQTAEVARPVATQTEPRTMPAARKPKPIQSTSDANAPAKAVKKQKLSLAEPGQHAAVISDEGSETSEPELKTTKLRKRDGSTVTVITPGE